MGQSHEPSRNIFRYLIWRDYISNSIPQENSQARAPGIELKPFAFNLFKTSSIDILERFAM